MIDPLEQTLARPGGGMEPITSWEVWFQTPKGLVKTLKEAVQICLSNDWDATMVIPVPVANGSTGYYEIVSSIPLAKDS
jgi:hypothetical protein